MHRIVRYRVFLWSTRILDILDKDLGVVLLCILRDSDLNIRGQKSISITRLYFILY